MTFLLILASIIFFIISFFSVSIGLVLLVLSMLFSPEIAVGFTGIRDISIRFEDILLPLLFLALLARLATQKDSTLFKSSPLNKPILLLLGLSIISTALGIFTGWVEFSNGFFYFLKTVQFFSIFFLVVNYIRTESHIKLFLFFSLLVVAFLGFYTLRQVPTVEIFSTNRITAPFEGTTAEPATVGGYMALLLLIILSIFLYETRLKMKWLYASLGGIVIIPFLYTLNRTSYMALVCGLIYICFAVQKKWFSILLVCVFLTSPFWAPQSVKDRVAYTWLDAKNPGRELGVDQSFQERIYSFRTVWNSCKSSPLIGRGVASYFSDNQYARTLHEIGFFGLALWIWIFTRLFKISSWIHKSSDDGMLKGTALGYSAGLLGLAAHAFGAPTLYIIRIMEPFWFLSGLMVSLYLIDIKKQDEFVRQSVSGSQS